MAKAKAQRVSTQTNHVSASTHGHSYPAPVMSRKRVPNAARHYIVQKIIQFVRHICTFRIGCVALAIMCARQLHGGCQ